MGIFDIFKKKDTRIIVQDEIFGELEYKSDYCYYGKVKLKFFGTEYDVKIYIKTFNGNIEKIQYEIYNELIENFQQIEEEIVSNLLMYYNGGNDIYPCGEKNAYGPDNDEENKVWWPDIGTKEEMIKNIHIDEISIPSASFLKNERCIYVLFNCDWGEPGDDENGVAVEIKNKKVSGIGYKEISY